MYYGRFFLSMVMGSGDDSRESSHHIYKSFMKLKKPFKILGADKKVVQTRSSAERYLDWLLMKAASNGYKEATILLVSAGADVNTTMCKIGITSLACIADDCYSPLLLAMCSGNVELMKCLLSLGANPNVKDKYAQSPLHKLCGGVLAETHFSKFMNADKLCQQAIKLLVEYGASAQQQDDHNRTPLNLAQQNNLNKNFIDALKRKRKVHFKIPDVIKDDEQKLLQSSFMCFIKETWVTKSFSVWLLDGLCRGDWSATC